MLEIIVNDRQVKAALARLQRATGSDMTPAFQDIGEYLLRRADEGFRNEKSPYGEPWAPLSPRTIKRKASQKPPAIAKILQSSGLFRASFSYTASRSFVWIGSNRASKSGAPIGLFHQTGTGKLPKREVLPNAQRGLPTTDSREIVDIISDHISSTWEGATP